MFYNINSSVRPPGASHHSTGNAVDINRIANEGGVTQFYGTTSNSPLSVLNLNRDPNSDLVNTLRNAFLDEGALEVLVHSAIHGAPPDHIHAGNVE